MGLTSWIVGKKVKGAAEEFEDKMEEVGFKDVEVDGVDEVTDFAMDFKDTLDENDQDVTIYVDETGIKGTLVKTFAKVTEYAHKAATIEQVKDKIAEAKEAGLEDTVDALEDELDDLNDELDDIEDDIMDYYEHMDEHIDIKPIEVEYEEKNGQVVKAEVKISIENEHSGETLEIETDLDINKRSININCEM